MTETTHAEFATNKAWSGRGNLQDLVDELKRQADSRLDFVIDQRELDVFNDHGNDEGTSLYLRGGTPRASEWFTGRGYPIRSMALGQVGNSVEPPIPVRFYRDLVSERPETATELTKQLFQQTGKRRLVRVLDGSVRAFMSDRYRVLDNYDLALTSLQVAQSVGGEVLECSLSDRQMCIKFTSRDIWDAINERRDAGPGWFAGGLGNQEHLGRVGARTQGDMPGGPGTVHPVVTLRNSETGHGRLTLRVGLLRAICFNLATVETVAHQIHSGGRMESGIYSDEARQADGKATMLKCRDAIRAAFDAETFKRIVAQAQHAASVPVQSPTESVDHIAKACTLTKEERDAVLNYFLRDSGQNRYGLGQAVARLAQDIEDGDRATDIEDTAGQIIIGRQLATVGA